MGSNIFANHTPLTRLATHQKEEIGVPSHILNKIMSTMQAL